MESKKEDLLTFSLEITEEEREQSENLGVGYDDATKRWTVIVRHNGDLDYLVTKYPGTQVETLLGGYGIITAAEEDIDSIAMETVIEYMEKPKSFYFGLQYSKAVSCIYGSYGRASGNQGPAVENDGLGENISSWRDIFGNALSGKGVLCAIIDSGIDVLEEEFWYPGTRRTRILSLWDQEKGIIYDSSSINEAIIQENRVGYDAGQHGTNVALIACGNSGVAYESDIVVVKLGRSESNGFPRTVEIMRALDYVVRKGMELRKPVAINISFGNNYGAHNGNTLLEQYMDQLTGLWQCTICVGTGNEAVRGTHHTGTLRETSGKVLDNLIVEVAVGAYQTGLNIQIWKNYADEFDVEIVAPSGEYLGPINEMSRQLKGQSGNTRILGYYGEPTPYSSNQEIYIELLPLMPEYTYVDSGIWQIHFIPKRIVNGRFEMWLPSAVTLSGGTRFLQNTPELTLTIPSTARKVISVGAYDARKNSYGVFSGRGKQIEEDNYWYGAYLKPDILAPGVDVILNVGKTNERSVTGTSFATPFVTGASACLMQWGIVEGNDPFLYGEKVKAYLMRGAAGLPGYIKVPNEVTGWGKMCLQKSIP